MQLKVPIFPRTSPSDWLATAGVLHTNPCLMMSRLYARRPSVAKTQKTLSLSRRVATNTSRSTAAVQRGGQARETNANARPTLNRVKPLSLSIVERSFVWVQRLLQEFLPIWSAGPVTPGSV
jgi:hypothetical protein